MSTTLVLNNFFTTKVNISWIVPSDKPKDLKVKVNVDYDVLKHKEDERRFRLALFVKVRNADAKVKAGWIIDCEMHGDFSFPEDFEDRHIQVAIRVNGSSILYGILRGQIASATGSFPPGKFVLPAVDMQDIVKKREKAREKKQAAAKPQPKGKK